MHTMRTQLPTNTGTVGLGFLSQQVEASSYYLLSLTIPKAADLVVVCGGSERCRPDYEVNRTRFRYHSVEFVVAGRGQVVLDGRAYPLQPGVAFAYGPRTAHRIRTDAQAPMTKYFVDFGGRRAAAWLRNGPLSGGPVQVSAPGRVCDLFDELARSARAGGRRAPETALLLLRLIGLRLEELAVAGPAGPGRAMAAYQRCCHELETRHAELESLGDLARTCHLAPAYVCRLFRRFGQTTPHRALQRRRMVHAVDLLQRGDLLVKEVAARMGFDDPFHFSRAFRREHGISPQQFMALSRR